MTDTIQTVNPLLEKLRVVHGETVRLPSRGLMYDEGVFDPNVTDGEIRISPMTIRDEILMRSPDALFSGEAIKTVLGRCAPQILNPLELHFTDLDFIMLALRKVSYGPELEVSYDHDCENHKEHSYIVNIEEKLKTCLYLDPLLVEEQFTLKISEFDQVVRFKPLTTSDMIRILQPQSQEYNEQQLEAELIRLATTQIHSVDGVTDRAFIYQWATAVPAKVMRDVRMKIEGLERWGINYKFKMTCRDCGTPMETEVPLNTVSFFT